MLIRDIWDKGNRMKKLKERLLELCHKEFKGKVRIIFADNPIGLARTEWFGLWEVPLIYFIDFLDSEIVCEDLFDKCFDPEDQEIQITVAG